MLTNPTTKPYRNLLRARAGAILEYMRHAGQILTIGALFVAAAVSVCADEIRLKDGTKINGVIVGFEDNSFKVKTSFGYALVLKDQVVSIAVADADKKLDAEAKPEAAGGKAAATTPTNASKAESTAGSAAPAPTGSTSSPAANSASTQPAASATTTKLAASSSSNSTAKAGAKPDSATSKPATANTTAPVPSIGPGAKNPAPTVAAAPAAAPAAKLADSESVREEVSGNTYTNRTWGFQMYKPPDWQVIEGARSMLPGAITAMGTSDQKTYLLIGQEAAGKSLASDMDAIEGRLREALENYRPLGEKRVTVSGVTAIQHKFRGSIDNHDWSGIVVFIPRDTHLYTIFGMTYADSDLVQIQENVISRAISSLQFTTKQ
jgi:hypothetical protein